MRTDHDHDREKFDHFVKHFYRLIDLKAPDTIKAHALVRVLFPRMMKMIGHEDCARELAALICEGLDDRMGVCTACHKDFALGDGLCVKCQAETDQWAAEMRLTDDGEDEDLNDLDDDDLVDPPGDGYEYKG